MNKLQELIEKTPSLKSLAMLIKNEPSLLIEELWETPKVLLALIGAHALKKEVLFITHEENLLIENFSYFSDIEIAHFPSWETLPAEEIAPSPDIIGKRLSLLYSLTKSKKPKVLLTPLQACLQKLPSKKLLKERCSLWRRGDQLFFDKLPSLLEKLSYRRSPVVSDKGEFAIRGGIIDLFPLSSPHPYRLEFFGDLLEEIRSYDPVSQKSTGKVKELFLSPGDELSLLKEKSEKALLSDYLNNPLVIFDDLSTIEDKYANLQSIITKKEALFTPFLTFFDKAQSNPHIYLTKEPIEKLSTAHTPKVGRDFYTNKTPLHPITFSMFDKKITTKRLSSPFASISSFFALGENKNSATKETILSHLGDDPSFSITFLASSPSEEQMLKKMIQEYPIPSSHSFEQGYLSHGIVFLNEKKAIFPYTEFSHRYKIHREQWRSSYHSTPSEFHELIAEDLVVHFQHGIGKYLGIEKQKDHLGVESEFLVIEYAGGSKFYTPVSQSHLISRYIGAKEEVPTLSILGSKKWERAKTQATLSILGFAKELLEQNAKRKLKEGFSFPKDTEEMVLFEEEFPFIETADQSSAIAAVKKDMESKEPMDRLICGDVGYGKTEVAMRAAFKAVLCGNKQVALLVPTTLLAMQHYETFIERMSNFPINIAVLSRFNSTKENKKILEDTYGGKVDILIGTHRLLSKDVLFKDLGLLIIDEEQRFGVRAKEHIKSVKVEVDCLTLSATPIPRTLYLCLMGNKNISTIHTPPQDRLPVKTVIAKRELSLIKNALLRELSRDGQAYFIHNRVESIFRIGEEIQKLLPQARIVIGHGQMSSDEIDGVFHTFKSGNADILISTTIVENGIDIPNANTILIDRSNTFGLADLYQLRGRVGRWNRPAYAYFLIPPRGLAQPSHLRLQALATTSGHGGGMKLAMRDLELRGAGNALGTEQSGFVSSIGFHLYCKLLKEQ